MANWWDEAYSDIANWSVNADQLNADRGAYKDAFQMNAAEKGLNYDVTSRLMDKSSNQERETMQLSADLDRRNTLDLMTGENQFKIAGMQEANRLSQDYLAAEGAENRANLQEQGTQSRLTQETANRGMADVEAIRAAASNYGQDAETSRTNIQADTAKYAQQEESRRVGLQGEQDRLSIGARGEQDRATVSRTAEEQRKTGISDREHAANLAVRYSRR